MLKTEKISIFLSVSIKLKHDILRPNPLPGIFCDVLPDAFQFQGVADDAVEITTLPDGGCRHATRQIDAFGGYGFD